MSGQVSAKIYRQYDPVSLASALEAVRGGSMSQRAAARAFCVPKTTLADKLAGRVPDVAQSGPQTVLTSAEESVLVEYVNLMARIGFPIKRQELSSEVKKILDIDGRKNPFKDNKPGMKRNSCLYVLLFIKMLCLLT